MNSNSTVRLLALSPRRRKFGYAVFEGSSHLLDWGVRRWSQADVLSGIEPLLRFHWPSIIVIKLKGHEGEPHVALTCSLLRRTCGRGNIVVRCISVRVVRRYFAHFSSRTSHDIACRTAEWFPELEWNLPRKRAAWDCESHSVAAFDAIATGIAFLAQRRPL